jgi:hypothetical protein
MTAPDQEQRYVSIRPLLVFRGDGPGGPDDGYEERPAVSLKAVDRFCTGA